MEQQIRQQIQDLKSLITRMENDNVEMLKIITTIENNIRKLERERGHYNSGVATNIERIEQSNQVITRLENQIIRNRTAADNRFINATGSRLINRNPVENRVQDPVQNEEVYTTTFLNGLGLRKYNRSLYSRKSKK